MRVDIKIIKENQRNYDFYENVELMLSDYLPLKFVDEKDEEHFLLNWKLREISDRLVFDGNIIGISGTPEAVLETIWIVTNWRK